MSEPPEGSRKGGKRKASAEGNAEVGSSNRNKKRSSGFRTKSPSTISSTASSTASEEGRAKVSNPSSEEGGDTKVSSSSSSSERKKKNQLGLLANVSVASKAEGESDASGVSDEPDSRDMPRKPQHQAEVASRSSQQQAVQQIATGATSVPEVVQPQLTQQNLMIQALQRIINQPSSISQPPNMTIVQQLAQNLVNERNNAAMPSQAPIAGLLGPASNAAHLLLSQLPTNNANTYQNPAPAINFIQKLQEAIIQQQLAGNLAGNPLFNALVTNVAAMLQQQNQLQQQQQLSSLLALSQLTNRGQFSMPQMPQFVAAQNLANSAMNPASAAVASAPNPTALLSLGMENQDLAPIVIEPTGRPALSLATDSDEDNLAPYQCLLRKQIELFETREDDIYLKAQGRNTPIRVGQVGIRCRHCASQKSKRVEGSAVLYSKTLNGIYQVALNMGRLHFLNNSCTMIPEDTKEKLAELKQLPRKVARGRQYWKETLVAQGVVEEVEYLRFESTSS